MRTIPKPGQWFRLYNSRWDAVFLTKGIVRMPAHTGSCYIDEDFLQVVTCKLGCKPSHLNIPLGSNDFEIITDPEEEALLAIAYGSDPAG